MSSTTQKPVSYECTASLPGSPQAECLEHCENNGIFTSFGYNQTMSDNDKKTPEFDRLLTDDELALAIKRRKKGMHLQEIEGNPLDAEDVAMFEMFERERWSHEKCLAYILDDIKRRQESKK